MTIGIYIFGAILVFLAGVFIYGIAEQHHSNKRWKENWKNYKNKNRGAHN